jgi:hypothetical protein
MKETKAQRKKKHSALLRQVRAWQAEPYNNTVVYVGVDLASGPDVTSYRDVQGNITYEVNDHEAVHP